MSRTATVSLELEEIRLVTAARAGDELAYAQLVRRNQVSVFHAAYLLTGSALLAQTLTVQAFVQAWRARRRLPAKVPFGDWVLSLAELDAPARAGADLPAAPDLSAAVLARLRDRSRRGRPGLGSVAAVAAMVSIAAVLVVLALHHPTRSQSVSSTRASFPLGLRIPLAEVRHAAGFTALMPPTPTEAYLGRDVPGGRVSMFAGRVLITEFRGAVFPYILSLIGPGVHAELTWVNGRPAVYGSSVDVRAPGNVLTWLQGPLTLRIEGASTLEQALALARTLS